MYNFLPNEDCVALVIDDIPSYYYKLGLAERPEVPSPERQSITTEVIGKLGSYIENFSFNDMTLTVTFNYLEDVVDYKAFKAQFYTIRKWLMYGKRLAFSDEPHLYYVIKKVSIGDALNDMVEYGEFSAEFILAPFAREYEDSPIYLATASTTDRQILIETLENSFPLVQFTALTATPEFRINDTMIRFKGLTANTVYYLDSELQVFYRKDTTGANIEMALNVQTIKYPTFVDGVNLFYSKDMKDIYIYRNILK